MSNQEYQTIRDLSMIEIRHAQETRQVYDYIYTGDAIDQMDSFFIWIQKLLKIKPGEHFLDISTGRGQMVTLARRRGIVAYGMDFSLTACRIAGERTARAGTISCGDAQRLPFHDNSFDVATNMGSLEHFDRMDWGIQEMTRVLKPGGRACLMVPNSLGLLWNVMVGWRTGDVDDDGQPIQRYGTRGQWQRILEGNGLEVVQVLGYEHEHAFPRTWTDLRHYWFHPIRTAIMLFGRYIPVNAAGQLVFLCRKPL